MIALEDVGFGDPMAVALTLEAAHSHRFRQRLGERLMLSVVVTALAEATGSRLICHLTILGAGQSQATSGDGISAPQRLYEASWLVGYLSLRDHGGMKPFVIPAWELFERVEIDVTEQSDPDGDELIGGYLAASYDMFTGEGRRAAQYLAKCPQFRSYTPDQISMGIWFAQSEVLRSRIASRELEEVERSARTKDLASVAVYDVSLVQKIREHLGLVNYARRRVLR